MDVTVACNKGRSEIMNCRIEFWCLETKPALFGAGGSPFQTFFFFWKVYGFVLKLILTNVNISRVSSQIV